MRDYANTPQPQILSRVDPPGLPELLEAVEALLEAIRLLGHARAASDASACDIEYDESSEVWRDHIEPIIMEPYDLVQTIVASD